MEREDRRGEKTTTERQTKFKLKFKVVYLGGRLSRGHVPEDFKGTDRKEKGKEE